MTIPTQDEINATIENLIDVLTISKQEGLHPCFNTKHIQILISSAKEVEQLRKENEVLLSDLQSCQAGHEALVKERDQLKLHVQVLREHVEKQISNLDVEIDVGGSERQWRIASYLKSTLSTTPSLNDYVPKSVADEMHSAIDELWDFMDVYHESHCSINDSTEPHCDCGYGQKYEKLKNIVAKALAAYESTQKEQTK